MDNSLHEQGSHTQQDPKRFLVSLSANSWEPHHMAGKSYRVDGRREEQEEAGIYMDRLGGE